MYLTDKDRAMLEGELGPAMKTTMSIIVQMGQVYKAERLLDVSTAHIDSSIYTGEASLSFADKLVQLGAKVSVPSTLNVSSVDELGWADWPVPDDWLVKTKRQMRLYEQMGCIPSWTCAPYQNGYRPKLGEHIAWSESNAVVFANSVLGARTDRYPGFLDICMAITGRAPAVGLHLDHNRAGQVLLRLNVPKTIQHDESFFPVLGYLVGKLCNDQIPVIEKLSIHPDEDQLKSMGAASASSGGVPLFHIIGVTPEAPTLMVAFQGIQPKRVVEIDEVMVKNAYSQLSTTMSKDIDMVVLGCPHFSLEEFRKLASLVEKQRCHPGVQFVITTSRKVKLRAQENGYLQKVLAFGAKVLSDTCVLITPILRDDVRVIMTNSAKCAYYAPGKLDRKIHFGGVQDCVKAAVKGAVNKENEKW